jgi:GNAT superfamily N-acetyltransferase
MNIRLAVESDFAAMWPIFHATVASGASYVFAPETSYEDAYAYWFSPGIRSYGAEDNGQIIGMYKMIPNQRDLGSHVANASFMVAPEYSGKGAGREMGLHCLREARKAGYLAMQFNFVVSTNKAAGADRGGLDLPACGTQDGGAAAARRTHAAGASLHSRSA